MEQLITLGLGALALIMMGVALGASIMWRVVNLPKAPPPLPVWVHALSIVAIGAWLVASVIAAQWLLVVGAVLLSVTAIAPLLANRRGRAEGEQP